MHNTWYTSLCGNKLNSNSILLVTRYACVILCEQVFGAAAGDSVLYFSLCACHHWSLKLSDLDYFLTFFSFVCVLGSWVMCMRTRSQARKEALAKAETMWVLQWVTNHQWRMILRLLRLFLSLKSMIFSRALLGQQFRPPLLRSNRAPFRWYRT